jgi:hypothetical protein
MYPLSKTGGGGIVALLYSSKLENNIPLTLNRVRGGQIIKIESVRFD